MSDEFEHLSNDALEIMWNDTDMLLGEDKLSVDDSIDLENTLDRIASEMDRRGID